MESSITLKIKNFTIDPKYVTSYEKFIGCLSDSFVSLEEFNQILELLNSKGIVIKKPSQFSIFANGYDYIKTVVEGYENLNCLQILIDNPLRLNNKEALNRLTYLVNNNLPYLDEKGKCVKEVYNRELFNSKYQMMVNEEPKIEEAPFAFQESSNDEAIVFETPIQEPTLEPTDLIVDNAIPVMEETPVLEPVGIQESIDLNVEPTLNEVPVSEPIVPVQENNVVFEQPVIDDSILDNEIIQQPEVIVETPVDEVVVTNEEMDPITAILSKPQTIALDDETFDRYDSLAESVRQVLCRVYNVTELNDNIIDNLIKLVTNGVEDDKFVMYTAITFGKNVSEEEKMCLTKAIEEELDYTNIMNIGLGRVA